MIAEAETTVVPETEPTTRPKTKTKKGPKMIMYGGVMQDIPGSETPRHIRRYINRVFKKIDMGDIYPCPPTSNNPSGTFFVI